jgi:hypothetical protein
LQRHATQKFHAVVLVNVARTSRSARCQKQFAKTTQAAEGRKNNTGGPKAARAYP